MINIDTNAKEIARMLDKVRKGQIPFAQSLIANRMAQEVKKNEISVMQARLDRPMPFTLNSLKLTPGNKREPYASVWFKNFAPKGTPAGKYLMPQVYGGQRPQKRVERALIARGYMKGGQYLVPASGAKMDAFGNMRKGQVQQVLSILRAFGQQGYMANATDSPRSRAKRETGAGDRYFWATISGETGVWERVKSGFGDGVKPIMLVTGNEPRYAKRYPFFQVAENTVKANYQRIATAAIDEAIRTAR